MSEFADGVIKKDNCSDVLPVNVLQALNDMDIEKFSGHTYELSFNHESDGIKKRIAMLPILLIALQEGRLVVIDELDAKLLKNKALFGISIFVSV